MMPHFYTDVCMKSEIKSCVTLLPADTVESGVYSEEGDFGILEHY